MKTGIELIAEERHRQIHKEGWSPEHDDSHTRFQMARAACCYILHAIMRRANKTPVYYRTTPAPGRWPWDWQWWKPKDPIYDLVRAGALVAAEIDRLQRKQGSNTNE